MKRILFLFLHVIFTFQAIAEQPGQTVRGTVVDAFTGMPIEGATVVLQGSDPLIGTVTDEKGGFVLSGIFPGRYSFAASMLGYQPTAFSSLMIISGKESQLTFKLEEKVNMLEDVVIKAPSAREKPLNESALVSARSFSVEETERFAGSLGDPSRMVSGFAGVVIGNDSRNDIIIRGNSPSGLLWRIDGVDVPNPNHFGAQGSTGGPVSMLNNNLLSNSDFITGAFPSEFGNALSGVFDLNVRSGNRDKFEFTGQVGFNGFEAAAEGPLRLNKKDPGGAFLIDYRYSTMQLVRDIGINGGTGSAVPEYNDLTVIVDLPVKKLGRFRFFGLYGNSFIRLNRSFDITETTAHSQIDYATDFGASLNVNILTHTLMLSEKTRLKSSVSYQIAGSNTLNDTIDYANRRYFTHYAGDLKEEMEVISSSLRHKFSTADFLTAGISANRYVSSFKDSVWMNDFDRYAKITDTEKELSVLYRAYAAWQHKFSDHFTLNAGMHYLYYDLNGESSPEPRLGLQWILDSKNKLSFGYGLHSQLQPRSVYFYREYHPETDSYSGHNRDLGFTKSHQWVLGYDWFSGKDFRIKSEIYCQHLYNVPVSSAEGAFSLLNSGSGYYVNLLDSLQNAGIGRNAGLELTVEKFLNKGYYLLMTLSFYDSKYQGYDKVWRSTAFNSNFAANVLAGYEWKIGKKNFLTFDVRTVWSGGMRYIPIDLTASVAKGEQVFDYSHAYDKKYKDYFRTDFRIGFKQNLRRFTQELGLDLQNVTDHKNLFSEQYSNQSKKVVTVYQQGFMPMMLYRINF